MCILSEAPIRVIKYCAFLIIMLIIAIIILYTIVSLIIKPYSLFFDDGDITFEHDSMTFVISNNNQPGDKIISISEPLMNSYSMYPSTFSKGTQVIDSADITLNPDRFSTSPSQPKQITISVTGFEIGEYHGWFVISGTNSFSVPVTLSTPPLIVESMMIIIIGALISIIVIEVAKYSNNESKKKIRVNALAEIDQINSGQALANVPQPEKTVVVNRLLEVETLTELEIKTFELRYSGPTAIAKQTLLSIIPALFALALALIAFVNDDVVTKVLELNFQNIVALFVLGAGIESVKGLLEKINISAVWKK